MPPQVSKETFMRALRELGHDPREYQGKRLSLEGMAELYELSQDTILDAIDQKHIGAHYDYMNDTIWVDALEAAHFFYCIQNEAHLYSPNSSSAA